MHEAIRRNVMMIILENRSKVEKWQGTICPNIFKKLKMNIVMSGNCYVLWNGRMTLKCKRKNIRDIQLTWRREQTK